jgi:predicted Rossmann fold nucleotide-binding protein DprA/Smf involved in DNA uptake
MNTEFVELREALQERLGVIADQELRVSDPRAHLERLKAAASRLDAAISRVPPNCDPQLRHFLDRQSYVKALAWLEQARAGA